MRIASTNKKSKPKRSANELVEMMKKEKGITFYYISEEEAIETLSEKNNYLRTASYRKNYEKKLLGNPTEKGQYLNLDFKALELLAIADTNLRMLLLRSCIDVEHDLKVELLHDVEKNPFEDGYSIVQKFIYYNNEVLDRIVRQEDKFFTGNLVSKYFEISRYPEAPNLKHIITIDCPIWVLLELLSFGDFIKLYNFYYESYQQYDRMLQWDVINPVKDLRNACAHNNCILANLRPQNNTHPSATISQYVSKVEKVSKTTRKKKLASRPLFEICCLLYIENTYLSKGVRERHRTYWDQWFSEVEEDKAVLSGNDLLKTSYEFLKKIVDFSLPHM